jgi:hypothetical protein
MQTVKSDYEARKSEIEEYFIFLKRLDDQESTKIIFRDHDQMIEERLSDQLLKILIANGFLLLYNLIEATIRNSICEIYDRIQDEAICYDSLTVNFKKIWVEQGTESLKEGNFRVETLREKVLTLTESIFNRETISLAKDKLDFSGNLDARKIRLLAEKYGFAYPISNGDNLLTIKTKRNHLAHGDYTFADIGKDFTVNDISSFKDETILYLDDILNNIESYLQIKAFVVTTN